MSRNLLHINFSQAAVWAACLFGAPTSTVKTVAEAKHARCAEDITCTYIDCIMGRAHVPQQTPHRTYFQLMMCFGMVLFMTTYNGLIHSGVDFFIERSWMYPLIFCISFTVRTFVGNRIFDYVTPHFIRPHFQGAMRGLVIAFSNTLVMGTIMCLITTSVLYGFDNYLYTVVTTLPHTLPVAFLVSYFVVGPAVKMFYNNVAKPLWGTEVFDVANRYVMSVTAFFAN